MHSVHIMHSPMARALSNCVHYSDDLNPADHVINVTGSEKKYIVPHTMIFLYKRCCSKKRIIFYSLKKMFFWV